MSDSLIADSISSLVAWRGKKRQLQYCVGFFPNISQFGFIVQDKRNTKVWIRDVFFCQQQWWKKKIYLNNYSVCYKPETLWAVCVPVIFECALLHRCFMHGRVQVWSAEQYREHLSSLLPLYLYRQSTGLAETLRNAIEKGITTHNKPWGTQWPLYHWKNKCTNCVVP